MTSATPSSTLPPLTTSGTVISFHPFTTAWAAPSECSNIFMAITTSESYHLTAFYPEYGLSVNESIKCLPTEFTKYRSTGKPRSTQTYLGPFTCPDDWAEATTSVISSSFTKTMCCPSGYDKALANDASGNKAWGTCLSSVDPNKGFTYAYLNEEDKWIVTTNTSVTSPSTHPPYRTVIGYTGVTGFNTAAVTSSSLPETGFGADSGSGLSTGAKAGIGVGVAVGVTALLALLGFFYFMTRGRRKTSAGNSIANNSGKFEYPTELSGTEPCELDAKNGPHPHPLELQSKNDRPELQGGEGGLRQELEGENNWPPLELEATAQLDKVAERKTGDNSINT